MMRYQGLEEWLTHGNKTKLRERLEKNGFADHMDKLQKGGNILHYCVWESHFKGGIFLAETSPQFLTETDNNLDTPLMAAMDAPGRWEFELFSIDKNVYNLSFLVTNGTAAASRCKRLSGWNTTGSWLLTRPSAK